MPLAVPNLPDTLGVYDLIEKGFFSYLSHNCPDFLRVPYLNVEGFVQLDQQMRKFPVLRVFTEIWSQCRFQPSFVPATVREPGCPARERENDLLGHRH